MICAAFFDLCDDPVVAAQPTVLRVWVRLARTRARIFVEPQEVKAAGLASDLNVDPRTIQAALALLIDRGYAVDHGRSGHNMRRLTLVIEREPSAVDAKA